MPQGPTADRPASRRPFSWAGAARWVLAAAAAPLFAAFVWHHDGIASLGDDSVSYLMMARWFAGNADAFITEWMPWQTRFPPLFPLALALTGGGNALAAHLTVAAFAALSVGLLARYSALRLGNDAAGLAIALAFLLLPTAWISVKGILSESMYLAITLVVLHYHDTRLARGGARPGAYVVLGLLLGAAVLTRAAGVALAAAYAARALVDYVTARERRPVAWIPLVAPLVLSALWTLLRSGGEEYNVALGRAAAIWLGDPANALGIAGVAFTGGWLSSFLADSTASGVPPALVYALGAVALAGTLRAAARNRLDGWYVLGALGLLFILPYGESNTRRMLYPLVPLALIHAAEALVAAFDALRVRRSGALAAAALAIALAPCLPALLGVAQKASHRATLVPGSRYVAADLTEYYTTVNLQQARVLAAQQAAVLGGLERLATDTSPDARIMWMRPEYVALLGKRAGVPSYFAWDARRLAREVRDAKVDFIVIAALYKSDLDQRAGDPALTLRDVQPYVVERARTVNPYSGQLEFILYEVDPAAVEAYLAGAPGTR